MVGKKKIYALKFKQEAASLAGAKHVEKGDERSNSDGWLTDVGKDLSHSKMFTAPAAKPRSREDDTRQSQKPAALLSITYTE